MVNEVVEADPALLFVRIVTLGAVGLEQGTVPGGHRNRGRFGHETGTRNKGGENNN